MKNITKEEYLKLLDAVLKEQQIDDLEVNKEYLNDEPVKKSLRFNYVETQGVIDATEMTREAIDFAWKNQGNVKVGNFLLKVTAFVESDNPHIHFNLYDYEKDEKGKVIATKIDINKDIRFTNVAWKEYYNKSRITPFMNAPLYITLDVIEWLQKLDKLGAFV